jgi:RNA polymerase sigma factor (sigma-70 family)
MSGRGDNGEVGCGCHTSTQAVDSGSGMRGFSFATTRWTVVRNAGSPGSSDALGALETLCRTYWHPVHAFVMRSGVSAEEAKDLTQDYFRHLIASNIPAQADANKGKFRSFLLLTLKHFLTDEYRRSTNGRRIPVGSVQPLDAADPQWVPEELLCTSAPPEKVFDQSWARTLVTEARRRLEAECRSSGKHEFFQAARDYLPGGQCQRPYAELAQTFKIDVNVVKIRIHRLRERFRELLRDEIAQTVSTPAEVDEELRYLVDVLSQPDADPPS